MAFQSVMGYGRRLLFKLPHRPHNLAYEDWVQGAMLIYADIVIIHFGLAPFLFGSKTKE